MRYAPYPELISAPVSDDILLLEGADTSAGNGGTETYVIPAGQALEHASSLNWGFGFNDPTLCTIDSPALGPGNGGFSIGTSHACAFDLFTQGTLAPGWTFESFEVDDSGSVPDVRDCQFVEAIWPTVGGNSLRALITVFKRPWPRCLICMDPPIFCLRAYESVRLSGPPNADWRTAFPPAPPP